MSTGGPGRIPGWAEFIVPLRSFDIIYGLSVESPTAAQLLTLCVEHILASTMPQMEQGQYSR